MATSNEITGIQLVAEYMEAFYNKHVDFDANLMTENRKIAESFINDLKVAIERNVKDLPLSVGGIEKQGSAFEGLKCGQPDEFDFALQFKINKRAGEFVYVEGRTIGATLPNRERAAGYYKIELKSADKAEAWSMLTDKWPGGNKPCLSPRKVVQRMQSAIDKFVSSNSPDGATSTPSAYWRSSVIEIKRQLKGNPALTVRLTKKDGNKVDVDLSPCLIDATEKHFVPKRHPILKGEQINPNDPYELLWMRTESQKELKWISKIDQDGGERRKCMRILKAALASKTTPFTQFHSSYIVKTAWLHTVDKFKSKDSWKRWEVLALRLKDILEKLEVSFHERKLLSRFNDNENVLGRFEDPFLASCEGLLKSLNNKLKTGDTLRFVRDLGLDL